MQNLALKSYTSEKLNSNTEIFALVIYLVRNFAVICWNSDGNFQCLTENCTFLPTFLNLRHLWL